MAHLFVPSPRWHFSYIHCIPFDRIIVFVDKCTRSAVNYSIAVHTENVFGLFIYKVNRVFGKNITTPPAIGHAIHSQH